MIEPMCEAEFTQASGRLSVSKWITPALFTSAAITIGFWLVAALNESDTEALESPLILSVARQLVRGPAELYGPFGSRNPLVLIHAPLYYRAAGLAAWPIARAGTHPVTSARIAGRCLSILGLATTLIAAFSLAVLGDGTRQMGYWSIFLIAASPVLAGQPFAVRPDMAGVALQTAGVFLTLSALQGRKKAGLRVICAYILFGLAACVKQHLLAAAAVSTTLLLLNSKSRCIPLQIILRGLFIALAIVVSLYGVEWVLTGGRIWDAAFVAAKDVGRVHPGGSAHMLIVFIALLNKNLGLIVLLAAAGLIGLRSSHRFGRLVLQLTAIGLFVTILVASSLHSVWSHVGLGVAITFSGCVLLGIVIPSCALIERSTLLGNRLDVSLWIYLIMELVLAAVFFYLSTGSWVNYAIQAMIFAAVLTGRAASRVLQAVPTGRPTWITAFPILVILVSACTHTHESFVQTRNERAAADKIFAHLKLPPSAFFFTERPGLNRVGGRLDLVYDDWLYPVFESRHLAEPRSGWLSQSLKSGSIRGIVAMSAASQIEGTEIDLRKLGYHPDISVGPFFVWTR